MACSKNQRKWIWRTVGKAESGVRWGIKKLAKARSFS